MPHPQPTLAVFFKFLGDFMKREFSRSKYVGDRGDILVGDDGPAIGIAPVRSYRFIVAQNRRSIRRCCNKHTSLLIGGLILTAGRTACSNQLGDSFRPIGSLLKPELAAMILHIVRINGRGRTYRMGTQPI